MTSKKNIQERLDAKRKEAVIQIGLVSVVSGTLSTTCLVKAVRAANRGDYARAIYFGIMWRGFNDNGARTLDALKEKYKHVVNF